MSITLQVQWKTGVGCIKPDANCDINTVATETTSETRSNNQCKLERVKDVPKTLYGSIFPLFLYHLVKRNRLFYEVLFTHC